MKTGCLQGKIPTEKAEYLDQLVELRKLYALSIGIVVGLVITLGTTITVLNLKAEIKQKIITSVSW